MMVFSIFFVHPTQCKSTNNTKGGGGGGGVSSFFSSAGFSSTLSSVFSSAGGGCSCQTSMKTKCQCKSMLHADCFP